METINVSDTPGWLTHPLFRWSVAILVAMGLGIVAFEALDISVFRQIGLPHEFCYVQAPKLIWLHVVSDLLIGVAYVSISLTLGYLVLRASRDIPFHWVFLAFGLFIVSCGLTHFMEVWVVWQPMYWLSGYVKVLTATASVATAIALFPLVPKIFQLIASAREGEERRVQIEQLNQELQRFNYSVAHDLRSPLRGINGFAQALREDFSGQLPPAAVDYINRIQLSADRMNELISDLLRYATIGQQELQLKPVPFDSALSAALAFLDAEVRARQAEIVVNTPLPLVRADSVLLQVALQNLLANSLKFVAPGVSPRIEISANQGGGVATITIADNGVGLPHEAQDRVFRIFERFHREYPGTGIGLAIVQRAVERLGGEVGIGSPPPQGGTTFWIKLPLA